MTNGAITPISTINLCFKDTSIFGTLVGILSSGKRGCVPDPVAVGEGRPE